MLWGRKKIKRKDGQKPTFPAHFSCIQFSLFFLSPSWPSAAATLVARHPFGVVLVIFFSFAWFVGSRHLVLNWGLLGNPGVLVLLEIHG